MADYYQILQIPKGASINDVKKAYRRLAHLYHPDVSKLENARDRFIEINEAYQYLSNKIELEEKFNKWDQTDLKDTSQTVIDAWIAAERARIREQARRHAQMKFNNFKKTEIYRTTERLTNTLYVFMLMLGLVVLFGSIFGTYTEVKKNPVLFNASYIFSGFMIFVIGVIMTSYSIFKIMLSFWPKKKLGTINTSPTSLQE